MMMLMITSMMIIINIMFSMMIHPLAITLIIILQTMMICLITGSISYSFWFSYILYMIFLGGMLVLFIYITSLASNEMFKLPTKTTMMTLSVTIIMMMIMYHLNHLITFQFNKFDSTNMEMINFSKEALNLNQLYNMPNMNLTTLTILYLLLTLIIIVKMTQIQEGPLRQTSY